jgi:hypothetical protein
LPVDFPEASVHYPLRERLSVGAKSAGRILIRLFADDRQPQIRWKSGSSCDEMIAFITRRNRTPLVRDSFLTTGRRRLVPRGLAMTLAECKSAIAAIESGKYRSTAEGIEIRALAIAQRCRTATWVDSPFGAEAEAIACRADEIVKRLAPISAARSGTGQADEVASYPDFVAG